MRLTATDYRHPAEMPALVAGAWFAVTLLLAAHVLAIWLLAARPLSPWAAIVLGIAILLLLDLGLAAALARIGPHLAGLRASARPAGPSTFARVHEAAERVAERLGLPATPPVFVLPLSEPDSFTLGWRRPELFITRGLTEALDDLALRAALAHEMAHIRGGHVRLATAALLPLRARLAPTILLAGHALVAFALRGWVRAAELSADRAASVAAGGAEPVAHWLSVAIEESPEAAEVELHHYLTYGADVIDRDFARAELHVTHPGVARRIIELAHFVRSRRFANCLAIVGDLRIEPRRRVPDPAFAGVAPFVAIGLLAGIWLAPITVALTVALGEPAPMAPPPPAPSLEEFDPSIATPPADATRPTAPDRPEPASPARQSLSADIAGLIEVAKVHKNHGNMAAARQALEQAILADPEAVEAHYLLAWVYAESGDRDLAAGEFTATIRLADPSSEMYQEAEAALDRLGY